MILVTVHGADDLARRLANSPARLHQLEKAFEAGTVMIQAGVMRGSPVGVTAQLRGSWVHEVQVSGQRIVGAVGSPLVHSQVIERGRQAGSRMPPPDALRTWVERKLGPDVSPFVVARAIGQRGTKARKVLETAKDTVPWRSPIQWAMRRLLEQS